MAILQKLKSLLGFDDSGSERGNTREVGVTVERERSGDSDATPSPSADEDSASADTTESPIEAITEEAETPHEQAEPEEATEPNGADTASTEDTAPVDDRSAAEKPQIEPEPEPEVEAEPEPEPEVETEPEPEPNTQQGTDESVDVIKGIGPAYAERLADAGVDTVADLAVADATELESETDISAKRIQGWIDRAKVR